jgi:hypothetical protein
MFFEGPEQPRTRRLTPFTTVSVKPLVSREIDAAANSVRRSVQLRHVRNRSGWIANLLAQPDCRIGLPLVSGARAREIESPTLDSLVSWASRFGTGSGGCNDDQSRGEQPRR